MPKPEPQPDTPRHGLLAAGNFIIDHVKTIDAFPEQDMLVNITADTASNGGGPYNVLKDLSELGAPFPLAAAGLVGNDPAGDTILTDLSTHGIDTTAVLRTADAPTSYTDAMTVASTGRRTFFHHRGTNAPPRHHTPRPRTGDVHRQALLPRLPHAPRQPRRHPT